MNLEKPSMSKAAFSIRIPADVKAWLAARAEANSRTINGEVLAILKDAKGGKDQDKSASKPSKQ
jgi:hypothetical protein